MFFIFAICYIIKYSNMKISRKFAIAIYNALHEFKTVLKSEYMTASQIAGVIGCNHATVLKYAKNGNYAEYIGGVYRIHKDSVEDLRNYIINNTDKRIS